MQLPYGLVRYRCACGAEYLVAVQSVPSESWLATAQTVADGLGVSMVDGSLPSFACGACGEIHLRADFADES